MIVREPRAPPLYSSATLPNASSPAPQVYPGTPELTWIAAIWSIPADYRLLTAAAQVWGLFVGAAAPEGGVLPQVTRNRSPVSSTRYPRTPFDLPSGVKSCPGPSW